MKYCVLASGSQANATVVESGNVRLLIDAGLRCRTLEARLKAIAVTPESLNDILITHEHVDHVAGLARFVKKYPLPVFANYNTAAVIERQCLLEQLPVPEFALFDSNLPFLLEHLTITPMQIPHDTAEPVGYLLDDGEHCLGYFTDLGYVPEPVVQALRRCSGLILESNHDLQMLRQSGRGFQLISRISGRAGHLSNEQACEAVANGAGAALKIITLAHLSAECNQPELALSLMKGTLKHLGRSEIHVAIARQNQPLPFMEL